MDNRVIVIGNKPFKNFQFNSIIDHFDDNVRCNMTLPNLNNGTKCRSLALCNHLYENIITNKTDLDGWIKFYKEEFIEEHIISFYNNFNADDYKDIYHSVPHTGRYNELLSKWNCPYRFSREPRTGYRALFDLLLKGKNVFVSHFSIRNEKRLTYYVKYEHADGWSGHSIEDEVNILRWLHTNSKIDASLCLIEDKNPLSFEEGDLQPSHRILNLLKETT